MIFRSACLAAPLAAALLFTGCDRAQLSAITAAAPGATPAPAKDVAEEVAASTSIGVPPDASAHFTRVMGRLDIGGKMLHFEDHEGQRETYIEVVKALLTALPAEYRSGKVDPAALVDATGLAQAVASGKSMKKDADGSSWVKRGYDYLPKGRSGLGSLLGKQPMKFRAPTLPAATDLVVETRLDGSALPGVLRALGNAAGQPEPLEQFLKEPLPLPVPVTLEQLIAKSDLQILLGVDISSWKYTSASPQPVDFFLQIDGAGELLPVFLPMLEQELGKPTVQQEGGLRGWELPLPPLVQDKTLLLFDDKGTLTYASRAEYLKYIATANMKLGAWKEYQAATNHFPESGNLLAYVSPQVAPALAWIVRATAEDNAEGALAIDTATKYLRAQPWSFSLTCEVDGISTLAEMPYPVELDSGPLPYVAGTSVLFVGARAWKNGSDRAACILNIRNVQQAVRAHQNINGLEFGAPLSMSDIFGEDKFLPREPRCPSGGIYTFSKTIPKIGKLACTCGHPEHEPAEHEDW